jgi:hypothetical protein
MEQNIREPNKALYIKEDTASVYGLSDLCVERMNQKSNMCALISAPWTTEDFSRH